jgi:hypothetical protein
MQYRQVRRCRSNNHPRPLLEDSRTMKSPTGEIDRLLLLFQMFLVTHVSYLFSSARLRQHPNRFVMSAFGCQHQSRLAFIILYLHIRLRDE